MAQVDDEVEIRAVLAGMTADQPPAPPGRFAAVRRRAILHRRRQLASAAAAVAILVAAAITIPLGLHLAAPPPSAPRTYHVSERPPGPGSSPGLIATGTVNGFHWKLAVQRLATGPHGVLCYVTGTGQADGGCDSSPQPVTDSTGPVSFDVELGSRYPIEVAVVSSNVAALKVAFSNGQHLTVRPVDALGFRFVAVAVPYTAAVTEVAAYSKDAELAYAVPFTLAGNFSIGQWLHPGQPALPRPASYVIGSGAVRGTAWRVTAYIGPWGACFVTPVGQTCSPVDVLTPHQMAAAMGSTIGSKSTWYVYGEAAAPVDHLVVTKSDGTFERVPLIIAGPMKFFAYASVPGDSITRWAAFGADGRRLAAGTGSTP